MYYFGEILWHQIGNDDFYNMYVNEFNHNHEGIKFNIFKWL